MKSTTATGAKRQTLLELVQARGCRPCGTYECQAPMAIRGRRVDIDICIADIVAALNAANIETRASCCGHGKQCGSVLLDDGRELLITQSTLVLPREGSR